MTKSEVFQWCLAGISLLGAYMNINRQRTGFIVWIIGNIGWMCVDYGRGITAQAFVYFCFIIMNIYGIAMWKKS